MTTIAVRRPAPDEWQVYRAVRLAALTQAPEAFGSTAERERGFAEQVWRQRLAARNTLLAEYRAEGSDGPGRPAPAPCGLAGLVLEAAEPGPPTAQLVSVWVDPSARGRGVGVLLVGSALARAADLGVPRMRLWVASDNAAAQHLYERLGFRRTGAVQPIRAGDPRAELEMARTVPPASGAGRGAGAAAPRAREAAGRPGPEGAT